MELISRILGYFNIFLVTVVVKILLPLMWPTNELEIWYFWVLWITTSHFVFDFMISRDIATRNIWSQIMKKNGYSLLAWPCSAMEISMIQLYLQFSFIVECEMLLDVLHYICSYCGVVTCVNTFVIKFSDYLISL